VGAFGIHDVVAISWQILQNYSVLHIALRGRQLVEFRRELVLAHMYISAGETTTI